MGLPVDIGKGYSRENLKSFVEISEKVERQKSSNRFTRNVLIGFATPPALALILSCLPLEIPVVQEARGITYYITAGEVGWISGGVIIEGSKLLYSALRSRVSFKRSAS